MPWHETPAELGRARSERPVVVPAACGELFGILTPPSPDAPAAGRCVILLTRPRSHRNRMWVEGARRLALAGFHAFRFDYHGCGDSGGDSSYLDPNQPYREDVVAVIRHLREHLGLSRFVLCGSCFDARTALSAFPDEGGAIDGLVFMAAPVMESTTMTLVRADQKGWRHLGKALRNPENWSALANGERWRYMAQVVGRVARNSLRGSRASRDLPLAESFLRHFQALVKSRARALFLYGLEDPEYQSFRSAEKTVLPRLRPEDRARFEVEVWPGTVHGFLEMKRQRETFERALAWIEALNPARTARFGT
jgi:pimeloyl-ACP methyl ester carboxylesterase